jgi:methyl-accepting chemotaxis protein WspA
MIRLRDISIKTKLYSLVLGSAVSFALVLGLSYGVLNYFRVNGPVYKRIMARQGALGELEPAALFAERPYMILQHLRDTKDAAKIKQLIEDFHKLENKFRERKDYWQVEVYEGPVKQQLQQRVFPTALEFYRVVDDEYLPLIQKGDREQAEHVFVNRVQPRFETHRQAIQMAQEVGQQTTANEEQETARQLQFWETFTLVLSIAAVVGIAALGLGLARGIIRPTRTLVARVEEMASGASDLTARVASNSQDEVGQLAAGINGLMAKIHAIVQRVRETSVQLLSGASEIAAAARQQEATVQTLSTSTTEIAASVREISATGKELSGTMNEVSERAGKAATLAGTGRTRLGEMEAAMQHLVEATASVSTKLGAIREKADNINLVVTTITKVADQTNLLSINAAIEAEKAGEYGRGFLVVAREIRRLADQTAVATLDIDNMVRHMQDAVSAGVMQMDKFSEEVRSGVARIADINGQIGQIIHEVDTLSSRFQLVSEGVRNQAVGAEQINEAMAQVAEGSQQTRASLTEFNRAAAHLRGSVESLNQEVAQFKV